MSYLRIDTLAINPAALFLRGKALELYWLINHPHEPALADFQKVLQSASAEERKEVLERARMIGAYAKTVEEAVTTMPKEATAA